MVASLGEYRWSSYLLNVRSADSKLLDRADNPLFRNLGNDVAKWIARYQQTLSEAIADEQLTGLRKSVSASCCVVDGNYQTPQKMLLTAKPLRRRGRPAKRNSS
jgi:hypothetical protein